MIASKQDALTADEGRHKVLGVDGLTLRVVGKSRRYYGRYSPAPGERIEAPLGAADELTPRQAAQKLLQLKAGVVDPTRPRQRNVETTAQMIARLKAEREGAFSVAVKSWIEAQAPGWKGGEKGRNGLTVARMLALHATPKLGALPCERITVDDVCGVLRPLWTGKAETAGRVMRYTLLVIRHNLIDRDLPMTPACDADRIKAKMGAKHHKNVGRLATVQGMAQGRRGSHPAPSLDALRRFMAWALAPEASTSRLACAMLALTAVRSQSVRGMRWEQIKGDVWVIPGELTKLGLEFAVPITTAMWAVLQRQAGGPELPERGLVFPGQGGKQMSDMTLSECVKGWCEVHLKDEPRWVPHGLRAAFKSWALEAGTAWELSEITLGHAPSRDTVANAYVATTLMKQRRDLLEAWSRTLPLKALA
jgi:integrase